MENLTRFPYIAVTSIIGLLLMMEVMARVDGQSNSNSNSSSSSSSSSNSNSNSNSSSECTGAMMRSFSSCLSFLNGGSNVKSSSSSSSSSSSPTSECCRSLKDVMSNGQECLCLIVTGGVPFQVPINRDLVISLPRACGMSGVPIHCKGSGGSPVPSPDTGSPNQDRPNFSPGPSPPSPTTVPFLPQPFTPPSPSSGGLTPPAGGDIVPILTPPGMRPTLNPSAAVGQNVRSSVIGATAAALGAITLMKFFH